MKNKRMIGVMLVLTLLVSLVGNVSVALAAPSQNIALVPDGNCAGGGDLPELNLPGTMPDGVTPWAAPTFTDLSPASIATDAVNPIVAGGFDTVVLNCIDPAVYLNIALFESRIESFVQNGGKLIIYTSEVGNQPRWDLFFRPFQVDYPGATGLGGTLIINEENSLSTNAAGDYYIDANLIATTTDAAGDTIVFTAFDPNWCLDMTATNQNDVTGPAHAYSQYGLGLVIYNGLDMDYSSITYGAGSPGTDMLQKIWYLELTQPVNPTTGLPCGVPVAPGQLSLSPASDFNPVNTQHDLVATLVDDQGATVSGVSVNFTVAGVNGPLVSPPILTDAAGQAFWSYTGTVLGQDIIVATAIDPATTLLLTSNDAFKTWEPGGGPGDVEVGGDVYPVNKLTMLAPWMALAVLLITGATVAVRRRRILS